MSLHAQLAVAGGAEGVTHALGDAYARLGHEVIYYSLDDLPARLPPQVHQALFPAMVARRIASLQRSRPIDVLDASTGDASIWLAWRRHGRAAGPVVVTRSHGLEHTAHQVRTAMMVEAGETLSWKYPIYHGGLRLREVAFTIRHSDAAIFLNEHDRNYAVRELGVTEERTTVVVNGVHAALLGLAIDFGASSRSSLGIAQLGSYIRGKGISHGAEALGLLLSRHSKAHVTFLGTGCDRARVLADFASGVHDRISVVPRFDRRELPRLLRGHQVKLFPTYSEGFSLALLEGMACGLAPVTTATPGTMSMVTNEKTGLIVPPRNAPALFDALERLARDRGLLDRLRRAAHARAQSFRWSVIAEDTIETYRQARRGLTPRDPRTIRSDQTPSTGSARSSV